MIDIDDPEHLSKVTKGRHRHASGYVERDGDLAGAGQVIGLIHAHAALISDVGLMVMLLATITLVRRLKS